MGVDSQLELYTTIIGWMLYNRIWDLLVDTGLIFFALLAMFMRNWGAALRASDTNQPGVTMGLRDTTWDMVTWVTMVMFAGVPFAAVNPHQLVFVPPPTFATQDIGSTSITQQNDTSTYKHLPKKLLNSNGTTDVPLVWITAMGLSAGINRAISASLPPVDDIATMRQIAATAAIHDPAMRQEVSRFVTECYVPARAKWQRMLRQYGMPADVRRTFDDVGGEVDMQWMGSDLFQQTEGFYTWCNTPQGQPGKAWCQQNVSYYDARQPVPGFSSDPSCTEWWNGAFGNTGLKARLLATAKQELPVTQSVFAGNDENLIKLLLSQDQKNQMIPSDMAYYNSSTTGTGLFDRFSRSVASAVKRTVGFAATAAKGIETSVESHLLLQAIWIIQPLVLMALYALLPFVLIFSGFKFEVIAIAFMAIFTVKLWAGLWMIAWWVDQNLIHAMYPGNSAWVFLAEGSYGTKRILLDMTTTGLYLGLPFLFTIMMGWVGYRGLGAMGSSTGSAISADKTVGSTASKAGADAGSARKQVQSGTKKLMTKGKLKK